MSNIICVIFLFEIADEKLEFQYLLLVHESFNAVNDG